MKATPATTYSYAASARPGAIGSILIYVGITVAMHVLGPSGVEGWIIAVIWYALGAVLMLMLVRTAILGGSCNCTVEQGRVAWSYPTLARRQLSYEFPIDRVSLFIVELEGTRWDIGNWLGWRYFVRVDGDEVEIPISCFGHYRDFAAALLTVSDQIAVVFRAKGDLELTQPSLSDEYLKLKGSLGALGERVTMDPSEYSENADQIDALQDKPKSNESASDRPTPENGD
ncbi:MAG: hypothetical protein ACYS9X_04155 [Planctomycetota bacterium]